MAQYSHEVNDMVFQTMNDMQDIKTTYTSDIVLETRQFWDFPTNKIEGCWCWQWVGASDLRSIAAATKAHTAPRKGRTMR